ncbi:MAG: membrane protein required for colicin V production [Parcubacteria group bacterium Gr01-1014_13]|nr:MAG: membrane protein required for colicin V production [Parcubacteria group bacterium Gr01-1014_13]
MSIFDIVLLVIIASFSLFGLWFGLIHTLGSLIGTVFGVYLASRFYEPVASWIINFSGWNQNYIKVIVFVITFLLITRIVGFVFWIMEKFLMIFTRMPFIHGLDRIMGAIFGALEGAVVLGVSLFFISRFPISLTFMQGLGESKIAPALVKLASILIPLFPEAFRLLRSTVDNLI